MTRDKSKKVKLNTNPPDSETHSITWYINPTKTIDDEVVSTVHIQLRELLKETVDNWITDFNARARLTTNLGEFVNINLSPRGIALKFEPGHVFPFLEYGISRHYMRGYESAIKGDNPFMDEIKMPRRATPEKIITKDLLAFLNGYRDSMLDSYVMNFTNKGNEQKKTSNDLLDKMGESNNEIDPLSFIEPALKVLFLNAEKKALGEEGKFNTKIRCASFCELLYEKKYIINTKSRIKTTTCFAKSRYGVDITNALAATKKKDRNDNKIRKVNKLAPLKNCF